MIGEERDALAVPNTALRDPAELDAAADFLGISRDSLRAQLRSVPSGAFVVFTVDGGSIRAVPVRTGLTDFDYSTVREGLSSGDTVLILPTAGLLEDQARRQEWIQRRVGGGPLGGN